MNLKAAVKKSTDGDSREGDGRRRGYQSTGTLEAEPVGTAERNAAKAPVRNCWSGAFHRNRDCRLHCEGIERLEKFEEAEAELEMRLKAVLAGRRARGLATSSSAQAEVEG